MHNEKIMNTFFTKKNTIVLFWSREAGWSTLHSCEESIDQRYYAKDGIFGLEPVIANKDLMGFKKFEEAIKQLIEGGRINEDDDRLVMEQAFSIKSNGSRSYYKICCYLDSDDGLVDSMLFRIQPLEPEESYRYRLARIITNDKNPESFNIEVQRLFKNNPDREYAVIQFDIIGFKFLNRQYGEKFGDDLINYMINSLRFICNESQLYVRLTADVFMVLTPYTCEEDIVELINKIRDGLQKFNDIDYRLAFGVCYVTDKTKRLRDYGDGAAFARQSIKGNALQYYQFYDEKMENSVREKKWVENQMEKALENKEFVIYLQAKYSISSNELIGAEALVRWIHPERGLIPPMEFIPLFEENGFVTKLDRYVWERACECLARWKNSGKKTIPISINVSRKHMQDDTYIYFLEGLLQKYQLDKKDLELEITETIDDAAVARGVRLLKEQGFTLLMDDFGSGFSSLNMLKDTRFDVLKIDREFLKDFLLSERGQSIVRHTINMTKEIGLDVIAEGVENLEQAEFLEQCGCDKAQGFYYAKPIPVSEFEAKYEMC